MKLTWGKELRQRKQALVGLQVAFSIPSIWRLHRSERSSDLVTKDLSAPNPRHDRRRNGRGLTANCREDCNLENQGETFISIESFHKSGERNLDVPPTRNRSLARSMSTHTMFLRTPAPPYTRPRTPQRIHRVFLVVRQKNRN